MSSTEDYARRSALEKHPQLVKKLNNAGNQGKPNGGVADTPVTSDDEHFTKATRGDSALLDDVASFIRRFVCISVEQAEVLSLWTVHTHCAAAADTTPYMHVNSPEKQSGKTRLEEVEELLVANPWFTGRVSAACLTRKIDAQHPTLLLDESDAAFGSGEEYAEALRGILNSGHRRGGSTSCCVGVGANIRFKDFSTFCPKMLAGLNSLPGTIASRSIPIRMQRKTRETQVERFRRKKVEPEAAKLRRRIAAWSKAQLKRLREIDPELPFELSDRQADGAEPLLAIAELVGGNWPQRARDALVKLCTSSDAEDSSLGVRLLCDIAELFSTTKVVKLRSQELVDKLTEIETSPWAECNYGKKLTTHGLAKLLKPFEIFPRNIRFDAVTVKRGYRLAFFLDAWLRYAPAVPEGLVNDARTDAQLDKEESVTGEQL
jgi:hypothetical protein